jgi:hypothetical protein
MPFSKVSHVAHFSSALDILGDKTIRAGLVYDESKLNKDRILVGWLSPNHWGDGFRYGTVLFSWLFRHVIPASIQGHFRSMPHESASYSRSYGHTHPALEGRKSVSADVALRQCL